MRATHTLPLKHPEIPLHSPFSTPRVRTWGPTIPPYLEALEKIIDCHWRGNWLPWMYVVGWLALNKSLFFSRLGLIICKMKKLQGIRALFLSPCPWPSSLSYMPPCQAIHSLFAKGFCHSSSPTLRTPDVNSVNEDLGCDHCGYCMSLKPFVLEYNGGKGGHEKGKETPNVGEISLS